MQRTQECITTRNPDAAPSSLKAPPSQIYKKRKLDGKEGTKFEEYLNVMQPPKKAARFTEEELVGGHHDDNPDEHNAARVSDRSQVDTGPLLIHQNQNIKPISEPPKTTVARLNQSIGTSQEPDPADDLLEKAQKEEDSGAPARPAASDKDWIRCRTSRTLDLIDHDDAVLLAGAADSGLTESDPNFATSPHRHVSQVLVSSTEIDNTPPHNVETEDSASSQDRESLHAGRLFIRNLAYSTTEDEVRRFFESRDFGLIEEVSTG